MRTLELKALRALRASEGFEALERIFLRVWGLGFQVLVFALQSFRCVKPADLWLFIALHSLSAV